MQWDSSQTQKGTEVTGPPMAENRAELHGTPRGVVTGP